MKKRDSSFLPKLEDYIGDTPGECLHRMLAHTDAEGRLCIPAWSFDPDDEKETYYAVKMTWRQEDCEHTAAAFNVLFDQLKKLAAVNDQIGGDTEKAKRLLDEDLFDTWNQYIRPFDVEKGDQEKIRLLNEKEPFEDLTPEESAVLNEYRKKFRQQCAERVGSRYCAMTELILVRRLHKLFELEAPEIIIRSQSLTLVQAMAIRRYAIEFEAVE